MGGGLSSWWGELGHKPGGRPGKEVPIFSLEPLWRGSPFQIALNGNLFTSNAPFLEFGNQGGGHWCVSPLHGECSNGVGWVRFDCALDIPNNAIALALSGGSPVPLAVARRRCTPPPAIPNTILYQRQDNTSVWACIGGCVDWGYAVW